MDRTTASSGTGNGQPRRRVGRLVCTPRGLTLIAVLLFVVFEVGIRHVPPDGMTATGVGYSGGTPYTFSYTYAAPKDQQTIGATYAALNAAPAFNSLFTFYNCPLTPTPYPTSIAFTWHGIPVETWSTGSCVVGDTAGGIPDFLLIGHSWLPDGPLPPPAPR